MAKGFSYMREWMEVAPAPFICPQKPSTNVAKLETIAEEGAFSYRFEIEPNKVLTYLLPVVVSVASYALINRYITTML
ncbi:hypothetical protein NMG60_11015203 [Bertholletia excelsa]